MARHLLQGGFPLHFFARREEVAREFQSLGGVRQATVAELTRACDVIITIVTADPQLKEIALGPDGIRQGAGPGKILIDMSTVSPDTEREISDALASTGMKMLDAPVSGGPAGAKAATLAIMVGGDVADFESVRPILMAMGKHLFHMGPIGCGQIVKLVNQLIGGGIMALIAEGLVLAKAAGAELQQVADVIGVSSGNSTLFQAKVKSAILAGNFQPGFATELMRKDMALALKMGSDLKVPLPVASAAQSLYTTAMNHGCHGLDFSSIADVCAAAANQMLRSNPKGIH